MRWVIVLPTAGLLGAGFLVLAMTTTTDTPAPDAEPTSPAAGAEPPPAPIDQAVIRPESIDRTPTEIAENASTDPNRKKTADDSDLERLFSGGSLLPKLNWDFVGKAGTPEAVLELDYFNPRNLTPDSATRSELKAIIDRHMKTVRDREMQMHRSRFASLRDRYERGELESQRIPNSSDPTPLGEPSHPEEEVGHFASGNEHYGYRIQWGEDPEYDADRMEVLYAKQRAIEELRDFLRQLP